MIYTENQQYKLSLNQETFEQEGLAQILLINTKNEKIAERWIFISKENNYAIEKELITEKVGLNNNESLEISLKDQNDKPVSGIALTVKISKQEKDIDYNKTLRSYLNFSSEIEDMTAKIDTFFELSPTAAAFNLDNLLLVNSPKSKIKSNPAIGHEEYFKLKAKVFKNGILYPNTSIKLFIKDKYSINSYDLNSDDSSIVSISGNWFDSLTVFATDANYKMLELGFERNDYIPNKPKIIAKKPISKTPQQATPEIAILKTDARRRTYAGKTDLVIKPKNSKDTSSNILSWIALKLEKTKLDSLSNYDLPNLIQDNKTNYYIDGTYASKDVLSLINQRDIAQIDILYKVSNLINFGKKDGYVLNILSKSKRAKENAITNQNTSKWLAFEPIAGFKNRNRTLSGQNTILWAPDQVTDKDGKLNFKLAPYNKAFNYIITLQGIDKQGNVIETDMPLKQ
jgi:hypothetical protein